MTPNIRFVIVLALFVLGPARTPTSPRQADAHGDDIEAIHTPASIEWKAGPASLPPGAQLAVLEGDPGKEGPFTMRLKLPDGYRVPPHTHPKVEHVTVISGMFHFGMGETFDAATMKPMPAGTFGFWPSGMKHFVRAEGETIVQLHGIGPWSIVYLNPDDDPRK